MSETAFTPGPWVGFVDDDDGDKIYLILPAGREGQLALVTGENKEADHRLMTASPDLYEALRLLVADVAQYEAWQRPCHALDVAHAALAKCCPPQRLKRFSEALR